MQMTVVVRPCDEVFAGGMLVTLEPSPDRLPGDDASGGVSISAKPRSFR